jgi:transcriptional regulator with XRE-family HTH domain
MTTESIASMALGQALRRWRLLHRMKQAHAAELFGVAQSTISRWESGLQEMEVRERAKVEALVSARIDTSADRVLATLVSESPRNLHLICDFTHRLLACSPARAREFSVPISDLIGESLRRFSTTRITAEELSLVERGWYERPSPVPVEFDTGENDSEIVPIRQSRCRWTRVLLSDGTPARLVETLAYAPMESIQPGSSSNESSFLKRA